MRKTAYLLVGLGLVLMCLCLARGEEKTQPPSELLGIKLSPQQQALNKGQTAAVVVKALFADGSEKDVTSEARYRSLDPKIVAVAAGGSCTAQGVGEAVIVATYLRRSAVARVAVPQTLPQGFPQEQTDSKIDELVNAKLRELGIPPAELCTDQEFIRRVFLDVIGTLPKPEEARAFLADKDLQKRRKLIDQLLQRPEYADYWTLKWGDLLRMKSETPVEMWPNAVQAYRHWVHEAIMRNMPYDQFATALITATGSSFRDPAVNFYRGVPALAVPPVAAGSRGADRDPPHQADAVAAVFMGVRTECMRCHAHPTEDWTQDDHRRFSAFFAQVAFKNTKEYKEEIVCLDIDKVLRDPATNAVVTPKPLGGEPVAVAEGEDARAKLAAWLTTPGNPWFANCAANRVWYWLMGRGIVHEPDDLRPTNPPSNPELLAYLAGELVAHKYDVKHVFRLILTSRTYQRSSRTTPWNAHDRTQFSHYLVRRLPAESLADAIAEVTGHQEHYGSYVPQPHKEMPEGFRAVQLDDGSISSGFLSIFGRPQRDSPYEHSRVCRTSMAQELYLFNSQQLMDQIGKGERIGHWLADKTSDERIVEELFLSALSRLPAERDKQAALAHLGKDPATRRAAIEDLMWAVLNTQEFLFNH